jgi:choline dehydrogenase
MSWDVIIVGSGAAGSVIARRLVETTQARVLLLEAGGPDVHEAIHDPARSHELWHVEEDWDYSTVPQRGAAGRRLHLPRGRVLGGSTSTNGMIYIRGWRGDYDYWAYVGNAGWSYEAVCRCSNAGRTSTAALRSTAAPGDRCECSRGMSPIL